MKTPASILLITTRFFGILGFLFYFFGSSAFMGVAAIACLLCGLFSLVLPKVIARTNPKVWIFTGLMVLIFLFIPTSLIFSSLAAAMLFLIPLALVNAAFLLYSGLSLLSSESQLGTVIPVFLVSMLLVIKALFTLYDLTVWDNAYDPLGYLWLFIPIFVVLLSGLTLLIALPSRTKPAGILYLLLLPALMVQASTLAQRVDFRQETATHAERTVLAIEAFRKTEGYYPQSLQKLTPFYLFSLPKPMIIYGLNWCYESGENYYRLGYVDREHWSDPRLIGRIYKAKGRVPDLHRMCEEEISAMQERNPAYPYTYWKESE